MKIRQAKDINPIHVMNGDSITLYTEDAWGRRNNLLTDYFTGTRTIDRVAIIELEKSELKQLGMKQAIAGVFGKRK